jgi:allophanate hydrolase subunit 2
MLADRQTTGGYPKIATVARADLPRFVQMRPGAKVRFAAIDRSEAVSLLHAEKQRLARLLAQIRPAGPGGLDSERLLELNLAGDAVDAAR